MADFAAPGSIDVVMLCQPVALAFRDAADLTRITEGLDISVYDAKLPLSRRSLDVVASGWWTASRLPGFAGWPSDRDRTFVVDVTDRYGRYLPARFGLPVAKSPPAGRPGSPGAISPWPTWPTLNAARTGPVRPNDAPAGYQPDYIALFPRTVRSNPGSRAEVRAQLTVLADDGGERPASWAAMTVTVGGRIVGLGLADAGGALVAAFAYPPFPALAPVTGPRPAISWAAGVSVYFDDLGTGQPDFGTVLKQVNGVGITVLGQLPATALAAQTLTLGEPLTLRTTRADTTLSSNLYVKTP